MQGSGVSREQSGIDFEAAGLLKNLPTASGFPFGAFLWDLYRIADYTS
jgi:hypothetical protein